MNRRVFIGAAGVLAARTAVAAREKKTEEDVAPGEDLMREHGVLRRVMLVYDEAIRRIDAKEAFPTEAVLGGAGIIRRVIEDYHEKLEEDFLFPRLEKAGRLTELVATLRRQHVVGREVTAAILKLAAGLDHAALSDRLRAFNRMYRPHAAREDTVLFPAFHELVGERRYRELGDQFEDRERQVLGREGFEGAVAEVAKLEATIGVDDLARFTP